MCMLMVSSSSSISPYTTRKMKLHRMPPTRHFRPLNQPSLSHTRANKQNRRLIFFFPGLHQGVGRFSPGRDMFRHVLITRSCTEFYLAQQSIFSRIVLGKLTAARENISLLWKLMVHYRVQESLTLCPELNPSTTSCSSGSAFNLYSHLRQGLQMISSFQVYRRKSDTLFPGFSTLYP